jgi:hypothetical protein
MIPDGSWRLRALWRDDATSAPMTVDLTVSEGRVAFRYDLFGAFDLDGDAPKPFVLRRDGRIDFGSSGEQAWRTDLRDADIVVGGHFNIFFNEQDRGVYRIVKLARPGNKEIQ